MSVQEETTERAFKTVPYYIAVALTQTTHLINHLKPDIFFSFFIY